MIALTRLNGKELIVNLDQILFVEATPDTCLSMIGGERLMVREPVAVVVEKAEQFRRRIRIGEPEVRPREEVAAALPCRPEQSEVQSWTSQP